VPTAAGSTTTANRYPMRISTHLWHDADDVDRAVNAIRRIAVSQAA
jgi:selenocysteine lyase/cysteine desulfurase